MRKVALIKTIMEPPFNKALFSITPTLFGLGTANYLTIQIKENEGNFFVIAHPCDSNGLMKNKIYLTESLSGLIAGKRIIACSFEEAERKCPDGYRVIGRLVGEVDAPEWDGINLN